MTGDLVRFLQDRLDDLERVALAAGGAEAVWFMGSENLDLYPHDDIKLPRVLREHIGLHDPARTLRTVQSTRKIIETADDQLLRLVAYPYNDHPDYRNEWKP